VIRRLDITEFHEPRTFRRYGYYVKIGKRMWLLGTRKRPL